MSDSRSFVTPLKPITCPWVACETVPASVRSFSRSPTFDLPPRCSACGQAARTSDRIFSALTSPSVWNSSTFAHRITLSSPSTRSTRNCTRLPRCRALLVTTSATGLSSSSPISSVLVTSSSPLMRTPPTLRSSQHLSGPWSLPRSSPFPCKVPGCTSSLVRTYSPRSRSSRPLPSK